MKLVKSNFQFLALKGAKLPLNARTPLIEHLKRTSETLIRRRVLRRLIWVCIVCLCPTKRTPLLYGLRRWYGVTAANHGKQTCLDSLLLQFPCVHTQVELRCVNWCSTMPCLTTYVVLGVLKIGKPIQWHYMKTLCLPMSKHKGWHLCIFLAKICFD